MSAVFNMLRVSKEKREKEAREVLDRVEAFKMDSNWDGYVSDMMQFERQWRAALPRENKPWNHATDFNTHLTFSKVEDVHSVLFSFFATFGYFSAMPVMASQSADRKVMKERGEHVTELMKWSMQNESNSSGFLDRFTHNGVLFGAGYGGISYLRDLSEIRTEMLPPDELSGLDLDQVSAKDVIALTIGDRIQSAIGGNSREGFVADFIDDDGVEKEGRFWAIDDHPYRREGEIVVIVEKTSAMYDAPYSDVLPPWRVLVPASVKSLHSADRYWTLDYLTPTKIYQLHSSGIFNAISKKDLRMLLEGPESTEDRVDGVDPPPASGHTSVGSDEVNDDFDQFLSSPQLVPYRDRTSLEVIWEWGTDLDPDTQRPVKVVRAVLEGPKPTLLAKHRREFLNPSGRVMHVDWHLIPIADRYAGMGLAELLRDSQIEQNAFYQSRSDVLEIVTKPGGLYDPMSGLAPDEVSYKPGMMLRARAPKNAFAPFVFPVQPDFLFQEQVGIDRDAERAVGATDMGLGRQGSPNAPRTLGGTAIMVRQQQLRTDVLLRRLMYGSGDRPSGVFEWLHQYREFLSRYMPEEKEFLISGQNKIATVNRRDLQGRFSFIMSFDQEINNPQLRAANAVQRYQMSLTNPLVLQNPMAMWHITQDLWKNTGMIGGPSILPSPIPAEDRSPMSVEQELGQLALGHMVRPIPSDDNEERIQAVTELLQNQVRMAEMGFNAQTIPLLEQYVRLQLEALQMKSAAQRTPAANGAGPQGVQVPQGPSVNTEQTGLGRPESAELGGEFQV